MGFLSKYYGPGFSDTFMKVDIYLKSSQTDLHICAAGMILHGL